VRRARGAPVKGPPSWAGEGKAQGARADEDERGTALPVDSSMTFAWLNGGASHEPHRLAYWIIMTVRETIGRALEKEGPLCSGCLQVAAELRSAIRVTEVLHELEASGHMRRERGLCPGCQETRMVSTRTERDLRDVPPSPHELLKGTAMEETLLYANPLVVPGSLERDPLTGQGWITVRCLRPGCPHTKRTQLKRIPKHILCTTHRHEDAIEMARLRMGSLASGGGPRSGLDGGKISWRGVVVSIQPRIRLQRSFDERTHSYLGFVLGIEGRLGTQNSIAFLIAIGEGAQAKHAFRIGDEVSGVSVPVEDPAQEIAAHYKTSALEVQHRGETSSESQGPPYRSLPPPLPTYREQGHRRLDARTYEAKCTTCIWGCKMPVEIIVDQWDRTRGPGNLHHRMETFCYGPRDCAVYKAGPVRKVQGRKKWMVHEDDGYSTH
jgi:hypothetical protein